MNLKFLYDRVITKENYMTQTKNRIDYSILKIARWLSKNLFI